MYFAERTGDPITLGELIGDGLSTNPEHRLCQLRSEVMDHAYAPAAQCSCGANL
jgi:hypothetical protein